MRWVVVAIALSVFIAQVLAGVPAASEPPRREPPASQPVLPQITFPPAEPMDLSASIPRADLERMYRAELGERHTAVADQLYGAHLQLEKFFAAKTAAERKTVIAALEATKVDANVVGRLARLRMHWPELESGVYYINERMGPHPVAYFLGVPANYDRTRPWPLLVKLATLEPFLNRPSLSAEQAMRMYQAWVEDELAKHPDALVIMPVMSFKELWGPSYRGVNSVIQPLHHAAARVNIDPERVYLRGLGLSAFAVWNIALHYPTYFAAINPLAGGAVLEFQQIRVPNLRNVHTFAWHDAEDKMVKVEASRETVRLLRYAKCPVEYEETKSGEHAPSEAIAEGQYRKMRAVKRELYPKEVALASNRPDALYNRCDWVQVYQMLISGRERRALFQSGSGFARLYEKHFEVTATVAAPNRVEVRANNVESMRLHFNDQMIDFAKPVTVAFNGRVRFEKTLTPSVEEMLKDQLFLGRGWRYFTAVVDIDWEEPTRRPAATQAVPGRR